MRLVKGLGKSDMPSEENYGHFSPLGLNTAASGLCAQYGYNSTLFFCSMDITNVIRPTGVMNNKISSEDGQGAV